MTTIRDLEPCRYVPIRHPRMLAIGWLGEGWDHPVGETDPEIAARLRALIALAEGELVRWVGYMFMGFHVCELCPPTGKIGSCEVFVPGDGVVYAAPQMIVHYIEDHRYRPPDAFCDAVRACRPRDLAAHAAALHAICDTIPRWPRLI